MEYAHPESLVDTQWVADHGGDPNVRLVEVDVDTAAYEQGHVEGAVGWDWESQLQQSVQRDLISKSELEELLGSSGIDNDTTVILYGDNNNWFAAWAFWQLKYYGHGDVRLMNGGRAKWEAEGRPLTTAPSSPEAKSYSASEPDESIRAYRDYVLHAVGRGNVALVDVRAPAEYSGELLAPGEPPPGGFPARRTHPRGGQRPLGQRRGRGRHLQVRRRALRDILQPAGGRRQPRDHRLLPHRGALLPHLVRPDPAAGVRQGAQLRRLLDRVGEHRPGAHREVAAEGARVGASSP